MRSNPLPNPHNPLPQRPLQQPQIRRLTNRPRNDDINSWGFESVLDVFGTGDVEGEAVGDVWRCCAFIGFDWFGGVGRGGEGGAVCFDLRWGCGHCDCFVRVSELADLRVSGNSGWWIRGEIYEEGVGGWVLLVHYVKKGWISIAVCQLPDACISGQLVTG